MNLPQRILRAAKHWREMKHMPLRLEFVLTDWCNLNCKGCGHYSPLAPKDFASLEKIKADMQHLGKIANDEVKQVYLMGGETLLYPFLPEAMQALRNAFPSQEAYIFTNGLILGKMDQEFWEAVKRNDFIIAITHYPVNFDYKAVEELCLQKGVKTKIFADRGRDNSFFRFPLDPAGKQNKYISHFKCFNRGCVSVVDGYVYPCSISACIKHLNRTGKTDFKHRPGDRIPVKDIKNVCQILKLRDNPVPFCSYCKPPQSVEYKHSDRKISEWVDE
ncbi:MAG: radical SAM protein [Muribaculaceae bacterium]|nr:radical SAM protein [Muribaculaceae bacterium]MDE6754641.1 radical SAM protein [Muribaculaceae bacterium]